MVMWRRRTLKMNSLVASQVYTQRSVNMDTTKLFIFSVLLLLVITTVSTKSLDSQADSDEPRSCKKYGEACGLDLIRHCCEGLFCDTTWWSPGDPTWARCNDH